MSLSTNLLGLLQDKFLLAGIHIGNLVSQEVAKQDIPKQPEESGF